MRRLLPGAFGPDWRHSLHRPHRRHQGWRGRQIARICHVGRCAGGGLCRLDANRGCRQGLYPTGLRNRPRLDRRNCSCPPLHLPGTGPQQCLRPLPHWNLVCAASRCDRVRRRTLGVEFFFSDTTMRHTGGVWVDARKPHTARLSRVPAFSLHQTVADSL
eukprot:Gregarina_sp_Pseudo_9__4442@NODE_459_length_2798_cov_517_964117_g435_i0_p4_GENE_NODE_459_length_2798_cov_517_964117_g435_i0NODE_459_length_2798_cov_517_964117_g435_i0_p4_ORF_typecomplete_len160_score12_45HTH_23/PF13384_6/0_15_NODE_459_length_2798_cov_517_964117_g435_i011431622